MWKIEKVINCSVQKRDIKTVVATIVMCQNNNSTPDMWREGYHVLCLRYGIPIWQQHGQSTTAKSGHDMTIAVKSDVKGEGVKQNKDARVKKIFKCAIKTAMSISSIWLLV